MPYPSPQTTIPSAQLLLGVEITLDAVPTLEATHEWDGALIVHDHRKLSDTLRWVCRCREDIAGLRSLAEASLPADPIIGAPGTIPRPGHRGGKTVTYSGTIYALSARDLREATDTMLAAFEDVETERRMALRVAYSTDEFYFDARGTVNLTDAPVHNGLDLGGVPAPYQATFVIGLALSDPRIYHSAPVTASGGLPPLPGMALPWASLPVTLPSAAQGQSVDVVVVNPGRTRTPPVLRLDGPLTRPEALDVARGLVLRLDVDIPQGASVTVDIAAGTVTDQDGEDVGWAVAWPHSTWWATRNAHVPSGETTVRLTAEQGYDPAALTVTLQPASA